MLSKLGTRVSTLGRARGSCSGANANLGIPDLRVWFREICSWREADFRRVHEGKGRVGWDALKIFTEMTNDLYGTDIFECV